MNTTNICYGIIGFGKTEPAALRLEIDDGRQVIPVEVPEPGNQYAAVIDEHAESIRTGNGWRCDEMKRAGNKRREQGY